MGERILCTVCARGGSKGLLNKNIRPLAGVPLIAHTIRRALESALFAHVVVSTDSDEIADVASRYGGDVFFRRPAELATDTAPKLPVIKHAFAEAEKHYAEDFPVVFDLDATSPLRSVEDLRLAYATFVEGGFDNLVTATPSRRSPYFNMLEINEQGFARLPKETNTPVSRRQDAPKCYDMNASIYIWRRAALFAAERVLMDKTGVYVMPPERSIDIDNDIDFRFVEFLMREQRKDEIS